jgi:hypothetical protein
MGTAYTPGLTVTPKTVLRRMRRLPLKGDVLVKIGDLVEPSTIVARAALPGVMQSVKVAAQLGIEVSDLGGALKVSIGDSVEKGQILAESKSFFGLFKSESKSPVTGTVETISHTSGNIGVRQAAIPIEIPAYISGKIVETIDGEGATVETDGALVQGIFGVGGERTGIVFVATSTINDILDASDIVPEHKGKLLIAGAGVTGAALRKASEVEAAGIVAGGIIDKELIEFLGYDIGVAITGHENINITVIVTEGFGMIPMAQRTFDLLKSLQGQTASFNGATQIRAGVIRPEVIVPHAKTNVKASDDLTSELKIGTSIRIIREPYFGLLGDVTKLPHELVKVDSGASVRVLEATLIDGKKVVVPRANVEIIAG